MKTNLITAAILHYLMDKNDSLIASFNIALVLYVEAKCPLG